MRAFNRSVRNAAAIGTALVTFAVSLRPVAAATFGQEEVNQSQFIAIASPVGETSHQLLIVEQKSDQRQCWSESGSSPVVVDPLLVTFDFTGICGRSTDSNGYSIRVDGQDLGLKYSLRMRYRDNDIVLVGVPDDTSLPELEIGRAGGMSRDFVKINLDPGWRFTKRTFGEKVLGHIYLTQETGAIFPDIAGDIYEEEIQQAVALKFIAGFENNTFRPQDSLTREQLVSMILEALKTIPGVSISIPPTLTTKPYPDVETSRWSAAKIAFARDKKIVSGYEDGTFKPARPVSRAELMAIIRRAAEYAQSVKGQPSGIPAPSTPLAFSDIEGHWAADLITQLSQYCKVASPYNETGTRFLPNQTAMRNYAAAATLRMLNCVTGKDPESPVAPAASPTPTPAPTPAPTQP